MKKNYTPGQGCQCHAHSEAECGCDVDWTPREVYELREQLNKARAKIENQAERIKYLEGATNHATGTPLSKMREQRDRLAEALRKIADYDFVITLPDRMDSVRAIAREALGDINWYGP